MSPVKNVKKRLLAALVVCAILSVAFIGIVLAATDQKSAWSADDQAYAKVQGWYFGGLGSNYTHTYHEAYVSEHAGDEARTIFWGKYQTNTEYINAYYLDPEETKTRNYYIECHWAKTETCADIISPADEVEVVIFTFLEE